MKNEIKEIIKYLANNNTDYEEDGHTYKILELDECKLLSDYITNLQESEAYYYGYYKDYKSRCEKALEYIDKYFIFEDTGACYQSADFDSTNAKELYDILGGDDNE